MPYIEDRKLREAFDEVIDDIINDIDSAGELNYVITRLVHQVIMRKGLRYKMLNEVIGVLECAKAELLRVVVAPYEDKKRLANGSVSELDAVQLGDIR